MPQSGATVTDDFFQIRPQAIFGEFPSDREKLAHLVWENSSLQNPYYWSAFTLQGEWR
ncbi:MAG: hypothetical protein KME54_20185 [Tolypothrix brevis GSE-NOS-MK-07-07A]|jgi:CHAT domain-containing protein|nr:hypothetical protein [Tolypothrix brevis GSE-NOS-MK-07-07A]